MVTSGSTISVWWKCHIHPEHEWKSTVCNRTTHGRGCPYCDGKKVDNLNCLATLFPEIAAEWHPTKNGKINPFLITSKSGKKVWWICLNNLNHEWEASVGSRTNLNSGCPFCTCQKADIINCLATNFPEISAQWHPIKNENLTPFDVLPGSGKMVWWQCPNNPAHEWRAKIFQRTGKKTNCPHCIIYYKENKSREIIERITGKLFPSKRNISWLVNEKTKSHYQIDGYCEELQIILEHQGQQHCMLSAKRYHPKGMQSFFYQQYRDADKWRLCKEHGFLVIYTYYNQNDQEMEESIIEQLKKLSQIH